MQDGKYHGDMNYVITGDSNKVVDAPLVVAMNNEWLFKVIQITNHTMLSRLVAIMWSIWKERKRNNRCGKVSIQPLRW